MPDGAVYIGLALIGLFAVFLIAFTTTVPWQHLTIGYLIAMAVLVNFYTWRAYMGKELAPWQRAMARVALRFAGFASAGGRPFTAAKGDDRVRLMLMISLAASSVLIVIASFMLIR